MLTYLLKSLRGPPCGNEQARKDSCRLQMATLEVAIIVLAVGDSREAIVPMVRVTRRRKKGVNAGQHSTPDTPGAGPGLRWLAEGLSTAGEQGDGTPCPDGVWTSRQDPGPRTLTGLSPPVSWDTQRQFQAQPRY